MIKKIESEYRESIQKLDQKISKLSSLPNKPAFSKSEYQEILNLISSQEEFNLSDLENQKEQKMMINDKKTREPQTKNFEIKAHSNEVYSILLTEDEKFLISGSADMKIKIWDLSSLSLITTFESDNTGIVSLVCTADFQYIVSGHYNGSVLIWSVQKNTLKSLNHCHTAQVWGMVLMSDNKKILTCGEDARIILWNFPSMEKCLEFDRNLISVNCLALSKSNNFFITGADDCKLKIFGVLTINLIKNCALGF